MTNGTAVKVTATETKDIAKFNENFERIFGTKERLKKFEKNFAETITKPETTNKGGES